MRVAKLARASVVCAPQDTFRTARVAADGRGLVSVGLCCAISLYWSSSTESAAAEGWVPAPPAPIDALPPGDTCLWLCCVDCALCRGYRLFVSTFAALLAPRWSVATDPAFCEAKQKIYMWLGQI